MYLALKNDVIITLNVMGSVFKSFFLGKIKIIWHFTIPDIKKCTFLTRESTWASRYQRYQRYLTLRNVIFHEGSLQ